MSVREPLTLPEIALRSAALRQSAAEANLSNGYTNMESATSEFVLSPHLAEQYRKFADYIRVAAPSQKLDAFTTCARYVIGLGTHDEFPLQEKIDRLQATAEAHGLFAMFGTDELQARLAAACDNPFVLDQDTPLMLLREGAVPSKTADTNAVLVRVSDVTAQPIRWLWQHRIAYGKLSIIAGEPGLGKSQLTMHLAAAVTKGGRGWWPDCPEYIESANVIILSAEDDIADTIRPRLEAAGADLNRVTVLKAIQKEDGAGERGVNIGEDAQHIAQAIERVGGAGLIIIDPVSAYLGRMSGNNNVEVRFALAPVQALAMKHGPAVVAVSHLNKPNPGGTTALHRVTGSGAFSAAARAVFLVISQPDSGQRLFLSGKNNVGREQPGLVFEIEERDTPSGIRAPAIRWTGESISMTADEALAAVSGGVEEHGALAEAKNFLIDLLTASPLPRKELEKAADGAGISDKTLRRAKTALGVVAERTGGLAGEGKWTWRLPSQSELDGPKVANNPYDGHTKTMGALGNLGHLSGEGGPQ
jgi:putative DNA primase/helicase